MLRKLTPSDYQVMPWKNGGGTTTQLMIWPEGALLGGSYICRVSLARIERSGPFSAFPGYDRTIVQLCGPEVTLRHQGGVAIPLKPLKPYEFSGDIETFCELAEPDSKIWDGGGARDSAAEDFNVFVERTHARANVRMVTFPRPARDTPNRADLKSNTKASAGPKIEQGCDLTLAFVLNGQLSGSWRGETLLGTRSELLVAPGALSLAGAGSEEVVAIVVELALKALK